MWNVRRRIVLSLSFLALAGCTGFSAADLSSAQSLPTVTVATPSNVDASGKAQTGWSVLLTGTCSVDAAVVNIRSEAGTTLATPTCESGIWSSYVDISSLAIGANDLQITQKDSNGLQSSVATLPIVKKTNKCDSPTMRARNFAAGLAGGTGTAADPYIICTADQLQQTSGASSASSYLLQNDIDFSNGDTNGDGLVNGSDTDYVTGAGWAPVVMNGDNPNDVYFDGGNFEVRNLETNRPGSGAGLFDNTNYRGIRNLTISDSSVRGDLAGSIAATCDNSIILNVHGSGVVTGLNGQGGGLCALANAIIVHSSFKGSVTSTDQAGGLVGSAILGYLVVSESWFDGDVVGFNSVGGLVGNLAAAAPAHVVNSFSKGTVKGHREVGGLVGSYGNIVNSYSTSNVGMGSTSDSLYGGLAGWGANIYNSFFAGNVSAGTGTDVATLANAIGDNVNNSYWSGGTCVGTGPACTVQGTAQVSSDMFKLATTAPLSSWDFVGSSADGTEDAWLVTAGSLPVGGWSKNETYTPPFTGLGTATSPYLIATAADLAKIGSNSRLMGATYQLTANIDMTAVSPTFKQIGANTAFYGTLLGNGYQIQNYTKANASKDYQGLFASIVFGNIQNVKLQNFNVTGRNAVGGLAGYLRQSTLTRTTISGTVNGSADVGGLVGEIADSFVNRVSSVANVTSSTAGPTGGISGAFLSGVIQDAYSSATITGQNQAGGLIGLMSFGQLSRCYATGAVYGLDEVGGLVGRRESDVNTWSRDSFAIADVFGNSSSATVGPIFGTVTDATGSTGNTTSTDVGCLNGGTGGCNSALATAPILRSNFYDFTNGFYANWDFVTNWVERSASNEPPDLL